MTMIIDGTNGGFFPSWTTATRPASPAVGQMGYNTTTGQFDAYTSNGWVSVATSGNAPVSGPAFLAGLSTTQSFSSATATKINFNTEIFDTNNNFASSRFTPTVAGYYQVNAMSQLLATAGNVFFIAVYKNGGIYQRLGAFYGTATEFGSSGGALVYCNGSTDYIEIYAYVNGTSPSAFGDTTITTFSGALVRAA